MSSFFPWFVLVSPCAIHLEPLTFWKQPFSPLFEHWLLFVDPFYLLCLAQLIQSQWLFKGNPFLLHLKIGCILLISFYLFLNPFLLHLNISCFFCYFLLVVCRTADPESMTFWGQPFSPFFEHQLVFVDPFLFVVSFTADLESMTFWGQPFSPFFNVSCLVFIPVYLLSFAQLIWSQWLFESSSFLVALNIGYFMLIPFSLLCIAWLIRSQCLLCFFWYAVSLGTPFMSSQASLPAQYLYPLLFCINFLLHFLSDWHQLWQFHSFSNTVQFWTQ